MENITIKSDSFRRSQQLHAFAIFIIPLLGTIVVVAMIFKSGVGYLDIGLLLFMYILTMTGISVGFHRYLSHNAFRTGPFIRASLVILGSMAAQGSPIYWVSNHRRHHQFSDRPGDLHSPYFKDCGRLNALPGFWHAHAGWTFDHAITNPIFYCKDLLRDPVINKINRLYFVWVFLGLLIPAIIGGWLSMTWTGCFSGFLWGGIVRLFLTYQASNSINSIAHKYGSRPFNTLEQSRNNIWLVLPTLGEGWHNNHHAFPSSAFFGLKWWQIDLGSWFIYLFEKAGLVWSVKKPVPETIEQTKVRLSNINTELNNSSSQYGGIDNAKSDCSGASYREW